MNFLNKAKETANKINEGAPKTPAVPGVKPSIPGKPPVPGAGKPPVGVPGKPPVPGKVPGVPVPPKAPSAPVQKAEVPKVEENKTEAPLKNNNPFVKKPTATPAPKAEVKEETVIAPVEVKEEVKVPEITEAEKEALTAPVEVKEEIKEEPKTAPKKGGSRRKPAAKAQEVVSDAGTEIITENTLIIPKTQIAFEEAINAIKSGFVDEAWEAFRTENATKLNEIVISNDMTTAMIKSTLSELSLLKDSIWLLFNDTKTMFENLTAKEPEGLIERVKKISSKGANPEERKLNATYAVMNYKDESGNTVNLYELLDEIRERYNFLKSLMDGVSYKNSVLITMLGSLKLEK